EARIKIRLAPREQAEFQRRAYRTDLRSGKSRNIGVGLGCAMRQARQDDRRCLPARTGADLPSPYNFAITQIHLERTLAPSRKQKVTCRRINDAEHRRAMPYQGDIDGEIRTAVDELARAIKRIDQQESIAALGNDAERGILLRHAWQVGHLPTKLAQYDRFSIAVGGRHRRGIGLAFNRETLVIVAHDLAPGFERECLEQCEQVSLFLHELSRSSASAITAFPQPVLEFRDHVFCVSS